MAERLRISVAAGLPRKQRVIPVDVPAGTTAGEAVQRSGIQAEFPQLDLADCTLAIFGQVVGPARVLKDGERVEICRPLRVDPRTARRALAQQGLTMGLPPKAGGE